MKKLFLQNKMWALFFALAFASSVFLLNEYNSTPELTSTNSLNNTIMEKEAAIDEDEFESRDFYIFKNITGLINDLFSISM